MVNRLPTSDAREHVRESEAVVYGLVIIAVTAIALGLVLVARAQRHEWQQRADMRNRVRRL